MIRRIELVNFMSHPHTVIEPAEGLTVLTGENNTGKSAVTSALQILCRNIAGDYMVRHGERECRVAVETEEGNVLEWKRKSGTVSYTVNGREVHRLRGAVPDDLHDLLRLSLVETENEPFDVHFGEQKKPIFLLDESPARRATFFASSSDAIKLIEMQNLHRTRVREARNEEARLTAEKTRLEKRLETLAPLDTAEERVAQAEAEHAALMRLEQEISALARDVSAMERTEIFTRQYEDVTRAAEALTGPPEFYETEPLERIIRQMTLQTRRIEAESEAAKAASKLQAPPEMADIRHLSDLIKRMQHLTVLIVKGESRGRLLDDCPAPPEMLDITGVGRHIEAMEKAQKIIERCKSELASAEKRLSESEQDLRHYIEANNICPTCGQAMDADRILHQYHETGGGA